MNLQDLTGLQAGEFYGTLVDSQDTEFRVQFQESNITPQEIESFKVVLEDQVKENFKRIKAEARAILKGSVGEDDQETVTVNLLD